MADIGKLLLFLGLLLVVAGGVLMLAGRMNLPIGRLPGDLRFEGERSRVFIPLVSMLVLSVVASVLLSVLGWFFRHR